MESTLLLVVFGLRIFLLANPAYQKPKARKLASAQPGEMTLVSMWILQYSLPRMLAEQYFDCPWITQPLTYLLTMIFIGAVIIEQQSDDMWSQFLDYKLLSIVWLEGTLIYWLVNFKNFYSGLIIMGLINLTKYGLIKIATYQSKDEALHSARLTPGHFRIISELFPDSRFLNRAPIADNVSLRSNNASDGNSN